MLVMRRRVGGGSPRPAGVPRRGCRCGGAGRGEATRWVEGGGDGDGGDVEEVAGGAGEAAVGGERDQGGGEVGDGLDGQADRQRGGDAAAGVGGQGGGGGEPGEPEDRFAVGVGER